MELSIVVKSYRSLLNSHLAEWNPIPLIQKRQGRGLVSLRSGSQKDPGISSTVSGITSGPRKNTGL